MDDPRLASMSPDELRRHMRALGYKTQSDLANAIGVSRSAVSLWLEGKVGVPRPVAMLLRMLVGAQRRAFYLLAQWLPFGRAAPQLVRKRLAFGA